MAGPLARMPDFIRPTDVLEAAEVDRAGFTMRPRAPSKARRGEAGVSQQRFWERCVRGEAEEAAILRYMWANPVKHGWCAAPGDWPYSSFRDVPP